MAVSSAGDSDPYFVQRQVNKMAKSLQKKQRIMQSLTASMRDQKYSKYDRLVRPTANMVDTYTPSGVMDPRAAMTSQFNAYRKRQG